MHGSGLKPTIAMLGDVFMDMQADGVVGLPEWGKDRTMSAISIIPGGACANTARQLASLSAPRFNVSLFSTLGDDELGRLFLRRMQDESLLHTPETTLRTLPGVPQSCCIILSGNQTRTSPCAPVADRAMVSCYSSTERVGSEDIDACTRALPLALLHIGGYFNCPKIHSSRLLGNYFILGNRSLTLAFLSPCATPPRCFPNHMSPPSFWTLSCSETLRCAADENRRRRKKTTSLFCA